MGSCRRDARSAPAGVSRHHPEFKAFDVRQGEKTLEDTVTRALVQIKERRYVASLVERGIEMRRIHCFGIAFRGEEVLLG